MRALLFTQLFVSVAGKDVMIRMQHHVAILEKMEPRIVVVSGTTFGRVTATRIANPLVTVVPT
jgi:hypothetical protein